MSYVPPQCGKAAFHCARCNVYADQGWFPVHHSEMIFVVGQVGRKQEIQITALQVSRCAHCKEYSFWIDQKLLFPDVTGAPVPHPGMPDVVKADFEEARAVFSRSPRSSAALLRLAIQKVCINLGLPGKNLNSDIGELVTSGLPARIQKSLDIVRVVGNNQVHPGVLDVSDETATVLFNLVNLIVEDRIARPKQIDTLYMKLPEGARKQIEERDAKAAQDPKF
jgi:Domain of unknown function (DUF4145)